MRRPTSRTARAITAAVRDTSTFSNHSGSLDPRAILVEMKAPAANHRTAATSSTTCSRLNSSNAHASQVRHQKSDDREMNPGHREDGFGHKLSLGICCFQA